MYSLDKNSFDKKPYVFFPSPSFQAFNDTLFFVNKNPAYTINIFLHHKGQTKRITSRKKLKAHTNTICKEESKLWLGTSKGIQIIDYKSKEELPPPNSPNDLVDFRINKLLAFQSYIISGTKRKRIGILQRPLFRIPI